MHDRGRFIDLSHPVLSGVPGYPGLPAPRIEPHISHGASQASYAFRAEFEITRLFLVGNTGTYLDSPYHRFPAAPDIADLPLEGLAGLRGMVVDATLPAGERAITRLPPAGMAGAAVLFRTGWDARWGTDRYWEPAPFLDPVASDRLVEAHVALVGIDAWNVDDVTDPERPAHTRLLAAGIPIVEHLTRLDALPLAGFRFSAIPAPIRGAASMPVRAFAELEAGGI